jgi:hypothetical protein
MMHILAPYVTPGFTLGLLDIAIGGVMAGLVLGDRLKREAKQNTRLLLWGVMIVTMIARIWVR